MRILLLAAVAFAALSSGCSNSCQELGDRLCECRPSGTTKNSCTDGVRAEVRRLHPDSDANSLCEEYLDSCNGPRGIEFCDWVEGRCGKAACGLSQESLRTLQDQEICPGGSSSSSSSSSSGGSSSSGSSSGGSSSSSSSGGA